MYAFYALQRGTTVMNGVERHDFEPNTTVTKKQTGGSRHPRGMFITAQDPRVTFDSTDLATLLALNTNKFLYEGIAIADTDVVNVWWQKLADAGVFASGSVHYKQTINEGLLYPTTLRADQGADAALSCVAHAIYDATNDPITDTDDQALPSIAAIGSIFTLEALYINGALVEGISGATLVNLVNAIVPRFGSQIWAEQIHVGNSAPALQVRFAKATPLKTYGWSGTIQDATDSVLYLRKRNAATGLLVAKATEEHISLTFDEGMIHPTTAGGAVGEDALATGFTYECADDGVNPTIAVTVGVAIP